MFRPYMWAIFRLRSNFHGPLYKMCGVWGLGGGWVGVGVGVGVGTKSRPPPPKVRSQPEDSPHTYRAETCSCIPTVLLREI